MDNRVILGFVQNLYMGFLNHSYKKSLYFLLTGFLILSISTYSVLFLTLNYNYSVFSGLAALIAYLTIIIKYGRVPVQSDLNVLIYSLITGFLLWFVISQIMGYLYYLYTGTIL